MLIFSKALLFLWSEAAATACYTQNRSLIRKRHNKTPYELLHNRKPDFSHLHVFDALCYPTNDSEDLGKLKPKADVEIFVVYALAKKAFQIYNKRTRLNIETIHVDFDELTVMALEQFSSGPEPQLLTPGTLSSGLVPNPSFSTSVAFPVPKVITPKPADSTGSPSLTTIDQDAPSTNVDHAGCQDTRKSTSGSMQLLGDKLTDNRQLKKGKREIMPYLGFTKIIINHSLSIHKSIPKGPSSGLNTIKDDGVLSRMKFVIIREEVQEYGKAIPSTMTTDAIKQSEAYKAFISYFIGLMPPKKTREVTFKLGKSISKTDAEIVEETKHIYETHARLVTEKVASEEAFDESDGVPDELTVIIVTSCKGTGTIPVVLDEVIGASEAKSNPAIDWGLEDKKDELQNDQDDDDDRSINIEKTDDEEETDDMFVHGDEYVHGIMDEKMKDAEKSSNMSVLSGFGAPPATTVPDPLPTISQRVSRLERDVQELKQVDHSPEILTIIRSQVPTAVDKYLGSSLRDALQKKSAFFQTMSESMYFNKHPTHKVLYHALIESLLMDEEGMDQGVVDLLKQKKRQHDDQDEYPSAGPNQGKKTKRRRAKDSESSKKSFASKGNTPPQTLKSYKYVHAEESVAEPTKEVIMDAAINNVILSVKSVTINKLHGYGYLEEIVVKRADRQLYKFKEGDFVNLYLNAIEDMLLLVVQHTLFQLDGIVIADLAVALHMFNRSIIIKKRVEDVRLGVKSYQKKLNITIPQKDFLGISVKELFTPSFDLLGVVYEDLRNRKTLMRAEELYKFSNGTLKKVRDTLHHRLLNF
nr:retrovirus-related Pol polyprotein from transposon TNT 1-94 [Tanacetum cinerariifolium]